MKSTFFNNDEADGTSVCAPSCGQMVMLVAMLTIPVLKALSSPFLDRFGLYHLGFAAHSAAVGG